MAPANSISRILLRVSIPFAVVSSFMRPPPYSNDSDAKTHRHRDSFELGVLSQDSFELGVLSQDSFELGVLSHELMTQNSELNSKLSLCFYCAFEVTVFPIGEWSGIAETPSS